MKKTASVLVTVAVLSLGLTACNGGKSSDCNSAGGTDVSVMSMADGKSGGGSGSRGRTGRKPSGSSNKPGSSSGKPGPSKPTKRAHRHDDDCD